MKKRILFVLIFSLMLMAFSGINSFAAQHGALSLSASGPVKAGETVVLSVMLKDAADINGIAVTPIYDENLFELTEGTWKISGIITDFSMETKDGVIAFDEGISIDTTILTFALKVKNTTEIGVYTVGCSVVISSPDKTRSTLTANAEVTVLCTHSYTVKNTDAKYLKRNASCTSAAVYYYSCECGEKGSDTFDGETLDHSYTEEWRADRDNHWHECLACGERKEQAAHVFDTETTGESAQICSVCKYELAAVAPHQHDFTEHWCGDDATHWGKCSCEEEGQPTAHTWDEGKIVSEPDATEQGITLYTCTDCGRVKVEYTTPEQSQGNAAPLATDEAVAFGTGAVIGGLVGLIGGGIVFRFVVPKRKKVI